MKPYFERDGIVIYHGDCREILPQLTEHIDLVLTDPPYLTNETGVPIRGRGVAAPRSDSTSIGMPWGYSLDWLDLTNPTHWVVFGNYRMLGGLCSTLEARATLGCVFTWRKENAPRMTRPVPRLDSEFVVWARQYGASCERMGEFRSMVIDVPMPQAGCFAVERFVEDGGKAVHPTQKPIAVVRPFIERLDAALVLDPFMGTGTTLRAALDCGRRAIGIELEERYCEIAARRLSQMALPLGAA